MKSILSLILCCCGLNAFSQLSLSPLFADNMVLQQQVVNPLWGSAFPGEKVSVTFLNKHYSTVADKQGKWSVSLPASAANVSGDIHIITASGEIFIRNIIYGEVWVCGGQSNMEINMNDVKATYPEEAAHALNNNIRFMVVDHIISNKEEKSFTARYPWRPVNPGSIKDCSAIGYFYARKLNERLQVPVGLIITPWGGTTQQSWMPAEALEKFPHYKKIYEKDILSLDLKAINELQAGVARRYKADKEAAQQLFEASLEPGYDDTGWMGFRLPGQWEEQGYPDFDGLIAYRIRFNLEAGDSIREAVLHFPAIDDIDSTFINGHFIGTHTVWNEKRVYKVPVTFLREGENIIQVKVEDTGGGGGFNNDNDNFFVEITRASGKKSIELTGTARFTILARIGNITGNVTAANIQNQPSVLFNGMLSPLLKCRIKGFIWYQGESNVPQHEEFKTLFPEFIKSIRKRWNQGDFPFLFVQLSAYNPASQEPRFSNWAALRYAQSLALQVPNTAMAVSYDAGDKMDIHPQRKKEPGERLAAAALNMVYHISKDEYSGPVYKTVQQKDNSSVSITFDHSKGGLKTAGDGLKGFEVSYDGKTFVEADAEIRDNMVVIKCSSIPKMIRYAWKNAPMEANLYNAEGFPAVPFSIQL